VSRWAACRKPKSPPKHKEAAKLAKQVFNLRLDAFVAISLSRAGFHHHFDQSPRVDSCCSARGKPAVLKESEPVWLPDYAVMEGGRKMGGGAAGTATLALALAKELSGEAQLDRAHQQQAAICDCAHGSNPPSPTRRFTSRRPSNDSRESGGVVDRWPTDTRP
jgi:hypothetical protein